MTSEDLERCYVSALRILNHRFNSREELRRKLSRKKFEPEVIDQTLTRLAAEKWLDDARFAAAFVRTRVRRRIGPLRIERELEVAGVDADAITSALAANRDADGEREALVALCVKRLRALLRRQELEYAESAEGRNKLSGYLLKQGYDAALIRDVVREVLKAERARAGSR